jgi:hypothetical protein
MTVPEEVETAEGSNGGEDSAVEVGAASATSSPPVLHKQRSVSEAAEDQHGLNAPAWLRWFETPFHMKDPVSGRKLVRKGRKGKKVTAYLHLLTFVL